MSRESIGKSTRPTDARLRPREVTAWSGSARPDSASCVRSRGGRFEGAIPGILPRRPAPRRGSRGQEPIGLGRHQRKPVAEFQDHDGPVDFIDFCLDGRTLVGYDRNGSLWTRRAEPASPRRLLPVVNHRVERGCLSPDGVLLATWSSDQPISIWNLSTGQKENSYQVSGRSVGEVAFTDDGESLVVRRTDGNLRLWNFHHSPDSPRRLRGHGGREAWRSRSIPKETSWPRQEMIISCGSGIYPRGVSSPA